MLFSATVSGCGSSESDQHSDYLIRVARVLEQPAPALSEEVLQPFPAKRDLLVPMARETLNWVDFARLHRCDLGALMGFRNSGLGRVMTPVARLEYEQQWLLQARQCQGQRAAGPLDSATLETLRDTIARKQDNLQTVFWNAVFAGDHMQRWMGFSAGAADANAAQALRTLADQGKRLPTASAQARSITDALQDLGGARRAGLAQQQWQQLRVLLGAVTTLLRTHRASVCRNGAPTPKFRRLQSVFRKSYGAVLQPQFARAVNEDAAWVAAFAKLTGSVSDLSSDAFSGWYAASLDPDVATSAWRRTRSALTDHARAWQALADHCGADLFQ